MKITKAKKRCGDCDTIKDFVDFYNNKASKDGKSSVCKPCDKKRHKKYVENNRDKVRKNLRDSYHKHSTKLSWKYNKLKTRIKAKKLEIKILTFAEYVALMENADCHYCGGELPLKGTGLDRKNNNFGYELENVVPCCDTCNIGKSNLWSYEEWILIMRTTKKKWTYKRKTKDIVYKVQS